MPFRDDPQKHKGLCSKEFAGSKIREPEWNYSLRYITTVDQAGEKLRALGLRIKGKRVGRDKIEDKNFWM
jgi:hypothetical protein